MSIKFQILYIWYTVIGMHEHIYFTDPISPVLLLTSEEQKTSYSRNYSGVSGV